MMEKGAPRPNGGMRDERLGACKVEFERLRASIKKDNRDWV